MLGVVTTLETGAASREVWVVLRDFAAYANWHPFIVIHGEAAFNASLTIAPTTLKAGSGRPIIPARIIRFESCALIGWRLGIRRLLWIDETYTLIARSGGTQIWHEVRFSGPLARMVQLVLRHRVRNFLQTTDQALLAHLPGSQARVQPARRINPARTRPRSPRRHR